MNNGGQKHVSLGGWEIPADRLQAPLGAEENKDGAAEALRKLIRRPHGIEPLPEHGWIRLVDPEDLVVFACRSDDWGQPSWVTVAVERNVGEWRFRGSSYGVRPEPTRTTYGAGLRLAWPAREFVVRVGEHPTLSVLMINERSEPWVGQDGAEYWAIASLIDLSTGGPFRPSGVGIAGVGRQYELAPGEQIELPVALAVEQPNALPPTTFGIKASVWQLDLSLDGGQLRVLSADERL